MNGSARSDLIAGVVGAAIIILGAIVGSPLWVSIPVGALAYFLLRRYALQDPEEQEGLGTEQLVRRMRARRTMDRELDGAVQDLCQASEALLNALRSYPDNTATQIGMFRLYLEGVFEALASYDTLTSQSISPEQEAEITARVTHLVRRTTRTVEELTREIVDTEYWKLKAVVGAAFELQPEQDIFEQEIARHTLHSDPPTHAREHSEATIHEE